ncbi:autophagy-related protein 27 [Hyaloscypha finlandica]|nr:autophagy-related protein 27 [Hyaloscypha finlandica]KAH8771357.1 autophagy-related protein 27 [Hyaloscypha sp. PMI_1271]
MRLPRSPAHAAIFLFPFLTSANLLDCNHARADGVDWTFKPLGGPKSVLHADEGSASWTNTTYTIDLCAPLKRKNDVPADQKCPGGTRLCSIVRVINKDDKKDFISDAFPVAGELKDQGGGYSDVKWTRLKTSKLNTDAGKEGVRLEIKGGFRTVDGAKKKQKASVEFICDKSLVGDENLWDPEDKYEDGNTKREEKASGEPSLQFVGYDKSDKDEDVLTLLWKTKYACEETKKEEDEERKSHWGFFTWFIIIAFLSTATYLIFGSWLNYNRYGARGWDLLPHGDTIRDVPYLLKDWMRRVLNTLSGPGTRGGYAAV